MKHFLNKCGIKLSTKQQFIPNNNPKFQAMRDMLRENIKPLRIEEVLINSN